MTVPSFPEWNTSNIQAGVRAIVNTASLGIRPGIALNFAMIEGPMPSTLTQGWTKDEDDRNSIFVTRMFFNTDVVTDIRGGWIAHTGSDGVVEFAVNPAYDQASAQQLTLGTTTFANVVAHEVFWHAIAKTKEGEGSRAGDLSSTSQKGESPFTIHPDTAAEVRKSLDVN